MSAPAPDNRPTLALVCVCGGLAGAIFGAYAALGVEGAFMVGGVLVFVLGIALAWQ